MEAYAAARFFVIAYTSISPHTNFMKLFAPTRLLSFALAAFCFSLSACEDEPKPIDTGTSIAPGEGVFIANEGLFNGGNASVMYYKLGDDAPSTDLFFAANLRP